MLHSNAILKKFEELWAALQPCSLEFDPGSRLARGFADLGYEEFVLQGGRKLTSLYTGKVGELPTAHENFFFMVYSVDELLEILSEKRANLNQIVPSNQSVYCLNVINERGAELQFHAETVLELLLAALMGVLHEQ